MNEPYENLSPLEQHRLLDRLVDGEITHDEQRRLILSLEAQPDGWRRCALAFLEAQTWGREFQQFTSAAAEAAAQPVVATRPVIHRPHQWRSSLVIAASLALAFTLGLASRGMLSSPPNNLQSPKHADGQLIASVAPEPQQPTQTFKVTIPTADGDSQHTVAVPLIEGDEAELATLLADQQPVLSDLELKTLESTGHRVEQQRAYYPVELDDGRQAVLPMDLVKVQYTGDWQ